MDEVDRVTLRCLRNHYLKVFKEQGSWMKTSEAEVNNYLKVLELLATKDTDPYINVKGEVVNGQSDNT